MIQIGRLALLLILTQSSSHAADRAIVRWRPVTSGAIENFGRDEAKFFPAASLESKPEVFGLNVGDRLPSAGSTAALARCVELREAKVGERTWYRFRLETAYARSQPEYDWCRQRRAVDECDSRVPLVCEGRYYYLPKASGGVRDAK